MYLTWTAPMRAYVDRNKDEFRILLVIAECLQKDKDN